MNKLLLTALLIGVAAQAADEREFKSSIVTESYNYERQKSSVSVFGVTAASSMTDVSRVAVVLDGEIVTGEWTPQTLQSATAENFPRGTDVPAALSRTKLWLKLPDGSVVEAKIVRREKQTPEQPAR